MATHAGELHCIRLPIWASFPTCFSSTHGRKPPDSISSPINNTQVIESTILYAHKPTDVKSIPLTRGLSVRGLGRNPSKLPPRLSQALESFIPCTSHADVDALHTAVTGVDAIACAYTTDPVLYLEGGLLLLRAVEAANVKIFIAASWTQDWKNIRYGDFELYDSILAFVDHVAATSSINPVYLINGTFAGWMMRPSSTAGDGDGSVRCEFWGAGDTKRVSWTTMDDAAAYTIEILCNDPAVRAGQGGIFRFRSGELTLREMAAVYEKVTGKEVVVVCKGSLEDGERALDAAKKEKGRAGIWERLLLSSSVVAARGLWEFRKPVMDLTYVKKPKSFEDHLRERMSGGS
ncbi:uncharacterized protein KD926_010774 [Aspergillus affinis]|uniref:uncharacterized protein n=1 Tax=Aspergillus affinis TaxID=1070780 RepID=UPI0022FE71A7|nr:uncharacterized protein KD926_010774 [Aspergillus affinis]KAI9038462.1 hypothetical protein KD926_010774 [Aspergillus affinis]